MRRKAIIASAVALVTAGTLTAAPKVNLFKEFTATWCGYCPAVAGGLYMVLQNNPGTTCGLMIHGGDSYTTSLGNQLINFYSLSGYPTVWLDGTWSQVGSYGSESANANALQNLLNSAYATTDVTIDVVGAEISGNQYELDITVGIEPDGDNRSMRIYVTQTYDQINWPESNETQFNTLRQSAATVDVSLAPGESHNFSHTFTLSGESTNTQFVNYIVWAQQSANSAPAMIYQTVEHEHGELPPADVTVGANGDYTTIQAALDNVGSGSTVTVAPGTYTETLDFNGRSIHLIAAAASNPDLTVIDAAGMGRALTLLSGASGSIDGFTVTGGHASSGSAMMGNGSPTITNCVFRNNTSIQNYVITSGATNSQSWPVFANNHFCANAPNNLIGGNWHDGGENVFDPSCGDEPCDGDYNADGTINVDDILVVLGSFGDEYNVDDLLTCLGNFGNNC